MSVDAAVDGELRRTIDGLYPDAPAKEREEAIRTSGTGDLVMTVGSTVIRTGDRVILVDCGVGPDPVGSFHGGVLRSSLAALGLSPNDVTDVLYTHLHADHIGWSTIDGRPFFPNAIYRCDIRDWSHFTAADYELEPWELASTRPEFDAARVRLAPLADRMVFWEGDAELLPGVTAIDAAGHTPGTCALLLESGESRALILGDVVHSVPELLYGWRFPVHADPVAALAAIERLRDLAETDNIPVTAAHLTGMAWGRVRRDGDRHLWDPLEDESR